MSREKSVWEKQREAMVKLLEIQGIRDSGVLTAMGAVERHLFIPRFYRFKQLVDPYGDYPLPIGHGQTISQPFVVAYMLEKMKLNVGERVLEIGTGSGYAAAVLDEMGVEVFTIEIVAELARNAGKVLSSRVHRQLGDGYSGWKENAPFDAIIISCAPEEIPEILVDQLTKNGRMILPVGKFAQRLVIMKKNDGRIQLKEDIPVRFVPMVHPVK